jgi:hypothetical protein
MGNASSRSPELVSNDVISSLSPTSQKKLKQMAHSNFYELATLTVDGDTTRIDSESSTKSDMSQETQTAHETPNSSLSKLNKEQSEYEELEGRPYITSDPGFFFLPCDSDESDRMVILVSLS